METRGDSRQTDTTRREGVVEDIPAESVARGYEVDDVSVRGIVIFAAGLLAAAVVIHLVLWWMLSNWTGEVLIPFPQIFPSRVEAPAAPGPGVEAAPVQEMDLLRAEQYETLATYGWIDREEGVVRIPIERAMELLVEEGVPARDDQVPDFGLDPAYELDSEGGQEFEDLFAPK
jgi:hypothetical protein